MERSKIAVKRKDLIIFELAMLGVEVTRSVKPTH